MTAKLRGDRASPLPRNIFLVARREMLVRLRSRVFLIGTAVMVVAAAGGVLAASYLHPGKAGQPVAVHVGFSGGSQALEPSFRSVAAALGETVSVATVADATTGRAQVLTGKLDMAVSGSATNPVAVADESLPGMVEIALDAATQDARLAAVGLSPAAIADVTAGVPVRHVQPAGSSNPLDQRVVAALVVAILLFVSIEMYGILVAQGVVEEKATRIMEIVLATVRPSELLGGKILGIGLVGLLQLAIVAAAALVAGALSHAVSIPALGVVSVACYLAWFVLGFVLYAAAYASVAALVSRQEEVQSATAPITVVIAATYILMFFALPDPTSAWVTLLSFLPPAAPIFMSMRIAEVGVAPWQVLLAMALTVAAIAGVVWVAGRIYARSAMHTGARVRLLEAWRGR